jgi:phage shock protein PspC (stress-responsive transcriptional regulator)
MTETPQQERANPDPDPNSVNTENLRDYTQFRRSSYDRKIAGVAGGLGRHLNIDPVIIRVLFVVLCFFGGAGFVLYGAAWLMVPEDTGKPAAIHTSDSTRNTLLIIAAVFAGLLLVGDSWGGFGFPWPLALVALVVFGFLMSRDNKPADPNAPAPYVAPAQDAAYTAGDQTLPLGAPVQYAGPQYGWQPVAPQQPPLQVRPKKKGPILFGITLAVIAVAIGALGIYDAGSGHFVADAAYPGLALAIIGVMLVVGSFYGRPGGLVLLGIITSIALAGSAIAGPSYDGDRNLVLRPTSASAVHDSYKVPAGRIELDLTKVKDLAELDGHTISLEANAGELIVILPAGVGAHVDAQIDVAGAIDLPVAGSKDGFGPTSSSTFGDTSSTAPQLDLNLDLKFGHIEVRQAA